MATDAAVRADGADDALGAADLGGSEALPRQCLEDGSGGAYAYALAAPRTARLVGIAVGTDDDLGVLAPPRHVENADHLDVGARPDAPRTQDAGGHVVADHRVAGPLVAAAQREVAAGERRGVDAVPRHVLLELVPGPRPAAVAQMLGGIALEQQPQHTAAVLHGGVRLGRYHHAVGHFCRARRQELGLPVHGHETDATVAHDGQLGIPAQRGNLDARRAGGVEDRRVGVRSEGAAVDGEGGHRPVDIEDSSAGGNRRITL